MPRYKVEYEIETASEDLVQVEGWVRQRTPVTNLKVERLADPLVVEEFTVRVFSPDGCGLRRDRLLGAPRRLKFLIQAGLRTGDGVERTVEVTDA